MWTRNPSWISSKTVSSASEAKLQQLSEIIKAENQFLVGLLKREPSTSQDKLNSMTQGWIWASKELKHQKCLSPRREATLSTGIRDLQSSAVPCTSFQVCPRCSCLSLNSPCPPSPHSPRSLFHPHEDKHNPALCSDSFQFKVTNIGWGWAWVAWRKEGVGGGRIAFPGCCLAGQTNSDTGIKTVDVAVASFPECAEHQSCEEARAWGRNALQRQPAVHGGLREAPDMMC